MTSKERENKIQKTGKIVGDFMVDIYSKFVQIISVGGDNGDIKQKFNRINNSLAEFIGVPPFLIPIGFILILLTAFGFMQRTIT